MKTIIYMDRKIHIEGVKEEFGILFPFDTELCFTQDQRMALQNTVIRLESHLCDYVCHGLLRDNNDEAFSVIEEITYLIGAAESFDHWLFINHSEYRTEAQRSPRGLLTGFVRESRVEWVKYLIKHAKRVIVS